jgi:hypothetical protein
MNGSYNPSNSGDRIEYAQIKNAMELAKMCFLLSSGFLGEEANSFSNNRSNSIKFPTKQAAMTITAHQNNEMLTRP